MQQLCSEISALDVLSVDMSGFNHDSVLDRVMIECQPLIIILQNINFMNVLTVDGVTFEPPSVSRLQSSRMISRLEWILI